MSETPRPEQAPRVERDLVELEATWRTYIEEMLLFMSPQESDTVFSHVQVDPRAIEEIHVRDIVDDEGIDADLTSNRTSIPVPETDAEITLFQNLLFNVLQIQQEGPPLGYVVDPNQEDPNSGIKVHLYRIQEQDMQDAGMFLHVVHPGTIDECYFVGPSTPCFE